MPLELDLSSPVLAIVSAAALGFAVGFVPIGLAEVLAVTIGAVTPPELALGMLAAFTVAHVFAKVGWYWLGTFADRVRHRRIKTVIDQAKALMATRPAYSTVLLGSAALASVPPFHLAAIAAGVARYPLGAFLAVCITGRALRFAALASVPALLRAMLN
ncbi:MAG TPA: hypothetical protein VFM71_09555 [Gemmatimonadaceae bacterium]|nr:hypothetical protein [Gemmatimonadaceae bacterium]